MFAYIGSRTTRERHARGEGITVCRVAGDGALETVQVLGGLTNPSFLALNRRGDRLYTVHGDGEHCSVLAVAAETGTLSLLQTQGCQGRNPVHLALAPDESHLIVSNHLSGTLASLPLQPGGTLGPVVQVVPLPGVPGPHRHEQPFSKPHFNPFDPTGRWLVVPDKGLDRIFVFRFERGVLTPAAQPHVDTREGAGPRHVAFHPSGRWLYAVNELDCSVTAYTFDATTGTLQPQQWLPMLDDHFTGNSRAAEIEASRDGRTLYASHRGGDGITAYTVDPTSGRLTLLQHRGSEGRTPRFFALHPQGRLLYVLNEDSDSIVTIAVDAASGRLGNARAAQRCASPVCMVFSA